VTLLPDHPIAQRPLFAVYPRTTAVPQKVQTFIDYLREWVAAHNMNRYSSGVPSSELALS
jgi:DNA-binding transcriptional LysR family regulator